MQKVLTAAQMREVDRLTTERYGIPSIILMENAAYAVARVITEKLGGSVEGKSILILCGKGNNGGDGAALARILWQSGAVLEVILFGKIAETTGDARTNFDYLMNLRTEFPKDFDIFERVDKGSLILREIEDGEYFKKGYRPHFDPLVVVDALFGTGLNRPLNQNLYQVVCSEWLEERESRGREFILISIDIPSGLEADSPTSTGTHVTSDVTVAFTAPKLANVLGEASVANGHLVMANIGSPQVLVNRTASQIFRSEAEDVAFWMYSSHFSSSSYKNKRGHALMIAGSRDYTGAAVLCGDAAIRSGVGLVTIAVPESSRESVVARVSPEVMVRGIAETESGSASEKAFDEITEFLKNVDVIAVGSGLSSKEDDTKRFIKRIIDKRKMPIVIDADGLTALSPWKIKGDGDLPLILSPHEGEFRKLLGLEKEEFETVIKDRVKAVRDFATEHNVILVLKGERNLIGAPNGNVVVNPTGNPGLGKAGNGDTLTGIITGFIAQAVQMKIDIFETVVAAVYVAGMAGDIAEKKFGKRVMTASDVRECLAEVFAQFEPSGSVDS
jgi:NAD(P)H-hydrate epimerase